jgi:hypothetical protein
MSAEEFNVSYSAAAQMALLGQEEKAALTTLFSSERIDQPATTKATGDGRFVSRLGSKRVLWRRLPHTKPEILSIVDQSFATSG